MCASSSLSLPPLLVSHAVDILVASLERWHDVAMSARAAASAFVCHPVDEAKPHLLHILDVQRDNETGDTAAVPRLT